MVTVSRSLKQTSENQRILWFKNILKSGETKKRLNKEIKNNVAIQKVQKRSRERQKERKCVSLIPNEITGNIKTDSFKRLSQKNIGKPLVNDTRKEI